MIGRFLLWLSGVNAEVLARCPTERTKFVGVGGAVLTTSVMAAGSAALTLIAFVGVPVPVGVGVGFLWGLAIMNLDRWLVASMKRQESAWRTFLLTLPRFALAALIGTVISEPLVLRVFEPEIEKQAVETKQEELAARRADLAVEFARIPELEAERDELVAAIANPGLGTIVASNPRYQELQAELDDLEASLTEADQQVICENEGTCGSGRVGRGPAYQEKVELQERLRAEVAATEAEIATLVDELSSSEAAGVERIRAESETQLVAVEDQLARLAGERSAAEEEFRTVHETDFGLLARMEALHRLSAENPSVNSAQWTLRLFIIAIDSLPVLVKLFMSFGKPSLYDRELEMWEESLHDAHEAEIDADRQAQQIVAQVAVTEAMVRRKLEEQAAVELAESVVQAQKEIAQIYIAAWAEAEKARMAAEVQSFARPAAGGAAAGGGATAGGPAAYGPANGGSVPGPPGPPATASPYF